MPMLRLRGGTSTPRAGSDTTLPPIAIVPAVGCSSPATQRKVVVLPQPDGPSSTTISPASTRKLTPSTAAIPAMKTLRRRSTLSSADIQAHPTRFVSRTRCSAQRVSAERCTADAGPRFCRRKQPGSRVCSAPLPPALAALGRGSCCAAPGTQAASLPIAVDLVPLLDPIMVQLHVLIEVRHPRLHHLRVEALGVERRLLERGEIALLLDHEGLPLLGQAPVEEQLGGIGIGGGLGDPAGIRIDRRTLGGEENLQRRAVLLLRVDDIVEQRRDGDLPAHQRVGGRRTR